MRTLLPSVVSTEASRSVPRPAYEAVKSDPATVGLVRRLCYDPRVDHGGQEECRERQPCRATRCRADVHASSIGGVVARSPDDTAELF